MCVSHATSSIRWAKCAAQELKIPTAKDKNLLFLEIKGLGFSPKVLRLETEAV